MDKWSHVFNIFTGMFLHLWFCFDIRDERIQSHLNLINKLQFAWLSKSINLLVFVNYENSFKRVQMTSLNSNPWNEKIRVSVHDLFCYYGQLLS